MVMDLTPDRQRLVVNCLHSCASVRKRDVVREKRTWTWHCIGQKWEWSHECAVL